MVFAGDILQKLSFGVLLARSPFFQMRSKLSIIFSTEKLTFKAKCVTVLVDVVRDPIFSSEKQPRGPREAQEGTLGSQKCGFRMRRPSKVEFWGAPRSKHSQLLKKETPFFRVRSKLSIIFSSEKHTFEAKCVTVVVVFGRDLIFSSEKQPRSQLLKDVPCQMHILATQTSPWVATMEHF